ncbi:hypothetical protein BJV77DRAFT_277033 [Russula vinacea]|nr:hypothetical protein BJV77DRAFT_277033 [Russula vinacea]
MWRYLPYPTGSPKPLADTPSLLLLLLWSYGVNVDLVRYCIKYCTTKRPCVEFPLNMIPSRLSGMTLGDRGALSEGNVLVNFIRDADCTLRLTDCATRYVIAKYVAPSCSTSRTLAR